MYPTYVQQQPTKKKHTTRNVVLGVIAAWFLLCGTVSIVLAISGNKPSTPAPTSGVVSSQQPVAPAKSAAPAKPAPPAVPQIREGTWKVGTDFPAGNYQTTDATSDCYWSITNSGTNGSDIVDNHIGGGHLFVTLKLGQDFETDRCGTWTKVG
jgi:hypothetical protein